MSHIPQLYKALHPLVTAAVVGAGMEQPTMFQKRMLTKIGAQIPDLIAETFPNCGHIVAMVTWAAHCALSGDDRLALIVAQNEQQMHRVVEVVRRLMIQQLKWAVVEPGDDTTPSLARGVRLLIGCPGSYRRCRDLLGRCSTLVFEDIANIPTLTAVDMIELAVKVNPATMLCLLCSVPPCEVEISIRYLLRRSNRAYIPHDRRPAASFTTLLCHDQAERDELAMRIAQMPDLRRIIVMTHNKEVRELKQSIAVTAKLNTFAIHRATPTSERQATLADFIQSQFAVLVTMDAFTGIDMADVDAVINFYPPQKSMPDIEWDTFVACLQTTGDPRRPCLVATIAAPDDVTMIAYLQHKLGTTGPIINITPTHPDFEDIVRYPEAAMLLRGPDPPPRLLQMMQQQQQQQLGQTAAAAPRRTESPGKSNADAAHPPVPSQGAQQGQGARKQQQHGHNGGGAWGHNHHQHQGNNNNSGNNGGGNGGGNNNNNNGNNSYRRDAPAAGNGGGGGGGGGKGGNNHYHQGGNNNHKGGKR